LLDGGSADDSVYRVAAFRAALAEAGYVEGQNVAIEYRYSALLLERGSRLGE
jgi:hypothetical protein